MQLSDFDFDLPESLIAQRPLAQRSASRLLDCTGKAPADRLFDELPGLLRAGDLLVFNDTRVIKARLYATKSTGGRVELLVERQVDACEVIAQLRASHAPLPGTHLQFASGATAEVIGREDGFYRLRTSRPVPEILDSDGVVPLPPYIRHAPEPSDSERYQTVFARAPGAVAAPTAGLHFDHALIAALRSRDIQIATLTLHVGAGTFSPVRVENLEDHTMHAERFVISEDLARQVNQTRKAGGRVVAVGTTSLRALESAVGEDGMLAPSEGETRLFITPSFPFRIADLLVTNFHLPKSTLLVLVSAFAGCDKIRLAYAHAIAQRYRFFSYGDAMLLERP